MLPFFFTLILQKNDKIGKIVLTYGFKRYIIDKHVDLR